MVRALPEERDPDAFVAKRGILADGADPLELTGWPGRHRSISIHVFRVVFLLFSLGYLIPNGFRQAAMIGSYGFDASPIPKNAKKLRAEKGRLHHEMDM